MTKANKMYTLKKGVKKHHRHIPPSDKSAHVSLLLTHTSKRSDLTEEVTLSRRLTVIPIVLSNRTQSEKRAWPVSRSTSNDNISHLNTTNIKWDIKHLAAQILPIKTSASFSAVAAYCTNRQSHSFQQAFFFCKHDRPNKQAPSKLRLV